MADLTNIAAYNQTQAKIAGAKIAGTNIAGANIAGASSATVSARDLGKIRNAAKDFEAVFLSEMMKPMFDSVEVDPMFGGGKGEEVFKGMMVQEYGKLMAERGGIGLADYVQAEMIRIQEGNSR